MAPDFDPTSDAKILQIFLQPYFAKIQVKVQSQVKVKSQVKVHFFQGEVHFCQEEFHFFQEEVHFFQVKSLFA